MDSYNVCVDEGKGDLLLSQTDLEMALTDPSVSPLVKQYGRLAYLHNFGSGVYLLISDCPMMIEVEIGRDLLALGRLGKID